MGEKQVEFRTSLSVKECGGAFKSGVEEGRGMSAKLGGITAKLMGGESPSWYTRAMPGPRATPAKISAKKLGTKAHYEPIPDGLTNYISPARGHYLSRGERPRSDL